MAREFHDAGDGAYEDAAAAYKSVLESMNDAGDDEPIEPAAPAAEVKPERTPVESSAVEPSAEGEPVDDGVKRARDGKFAKGSKPPARKAGDEPAAAAPQEGQDGEIEPPQGEQAPKASAVTPPPSWGVKAKAAWAALPEDVRTEIAKREQEVSQGFAALRDYKDLKPFAELASRSNTTIAKALESYIGVENLLKASPEQGMLQIARNLRLPQDKAAELFANLAQKLGAAKAPGASGTGVASPPAHQDPLLQAIAPVLSPLQQQLQQMQDHISQQQQADTIRQQQAMASALDAFAADPANIYFPNLEDKIAELLERGMVPRTGNHMADLKAAYDMAARLDPEVNEALIEKRLRDQEEAKRKREQEAAAKAKAASRSITGSRIPGTQTQKARDEGQYDGPDDVENDVREAIRALSNT